MTLIDTIHATKPAHTLAEIETLDHVEALPDGDDGSVILTRRPLTDDERAALRTYAVDV